MRDDLKARWVELMKSVVKRREQVHELVNELRENSSYFTAPASTKYHCDWDEGLLEHSINVAENALALKSVLAPKIPDESCVICGLFHDLGKAPLYHDRYFKKVQTPRQAQFGYVPYPAYGYIDSNRVFLTVPQESVRILSQFMHLEDWEYQAILVHDGQYADENKPYACRENPFALILQYADTWSGFVQELVMKQADDGKSYQFVSQVPYYLESWVRESPDTESAN